MKRGHERAGTKRRRACRARVQRLGRRAPGARGNAPIVVMNVGEKVSLA